MRTALLVASILSMALLLPTQPAQAGALTFTMDLTTIGGGGQLSGGTTFSVNALSFVADTASRHISVQNGSLVLNGVLTDCTIESVVAGCAEATLLCEDGTHDVIAGVRGVSLGSLDGVAVTSGFIHMHCRNRSAAFR